MRTCSALIGVMGREESLEHTDPPVSCPCAQPVMSKASSSRALCLSLWALSIPSTSLPRAAVSPQGASRPSPQRPALLRVQPCPPRPPNQDFGCVPALLRVSFQRTRPNSLGVALWLSRSLIFMVFHVLCIASSVMPESFGGTCLLIVRWPLRKGKVDWSGRASRETKVVKLLCKLQSAIQWKLLLLWSSS